MSFRLTREDVNAILRDAISHLNQRDYKYLAIGSEVGLSENHVAQIMRREEVLTKLEKAVALMEFARSQGWTSDLVMARLHGYDAAGSDYSTDDEVLEVIESIGAGRLQERVCVRTALAFWSRAEAACGQARRDLVACFTRGGVAGRPPATVVGAGATSMPHATPPTYSLGGDGSPERA